MTTTYQVPVTATSTSSVVENEIDDEYGVLSKEDILAIDSILTDNVKKDVDSLRSFQEKTDDSVKEDTEEDQFEPLSQEDLSVLDTVIENAESTSQKRYISPYIKTNTSYPTEQEEPKHETTKILSIDIECLGRGAVFPQPKHDPIIQIGNTCVTKHGDKETVEQTIFTLGTCEPIENAFVKQCETEQELLYKWRIFLLHYNPDILTGFYFKNFDLKYMIQRAGYLRMPNFPYLGRDKDKKVVVVNGGFDGHPTVAHISGRRLVDMCEFIKRTYSWKKCKLNMASEYILGEKKADVTYQQIPFLQNKDARTRRKLAVYCLKDAMLAYKLFKRLNPLSKD